MPEESTTPDLAERVRAGLEAFGRADFDAALRFFAPNAMWAMDGGDTFEGVAAIRDFIEDVYSQFQGLEVDVEEIRELGGDVVLAVNTMRSHPGGSSAEVRQRGAFIYATEAGLTVRVTSSSDIDAARAAAERLAEERG